MNHLKINPIGLDAVIHGAQVKLYNELSALWNTDLSGYPRCYSIKRDGKKTIEHYKGKNEYVNLFYAEGNKFFITAEESEVLVENGFYKSRIEIFFIVNLQGIKGNIAHRPDNEARIDVVNVLDTISELKVTRIDYGLDTIFSYLDWKVADDMQPYHCFRIDCEVIEYEMNKPYCNFNN